MPRVRFLRLLLTVTVLGLIIFTALEHRNSRFAFTVKHGIQNSYDKLKDGLQHKIDSQKHPEAPAEIQKPALTDTEQQQQENGANIEVPSKDDSLQTNDSEQKQNDSNDSQESQEPQEPQAPQEQQEPQESQESQDSQQSHESQEPPAPQNTLHPIHELITEAAATAEQLIQEHSSTLHDAVNKYRERYKRQPPPGFDSWFKYVRERNCPIIDEYDQIMKDIDPYWGVEPSEIRLRIRKLHNDPNTCIVQVRNGKVSVNHDNDRGGAVMNLIKPFAKYLPDMDIGVNQLDEPRVVASHQEVSDALLRARGNIEENLHGASSTEYSPFTDEKVGQDNEWTHLGGKPLYSFLKRACQPDSPGAISDDIQQYTNITLSTATMEKSATPLGHFVRNFTAAKDICEQPDLRNINSGIISPNSAQLASILVPMFSECKLSPQNDIIIPATMYYRDNKNYGYTDADDSSWEEKKNDLFWIGVSVGGYQNENTFHGMQRHRLVRWCNTTVPREYKVIAQGNNSFEETTIDLREFYESVSNVAFTNIALCNDICPLLHTLFVQKEAVDMQENFRHRYLIDVDGQSFSARFRAFQFSKSLAIKSTLYTEWHDSRLVPWHHFVPLDQRYLELDSILAYFIGVKDRNDMISHESEARQIALNGKSWAEKAFRREDMEAYVFRLLLEYARVLDDTRNSLGFNLKDGDNVEV